MGGTSKTTNEASPLMKVQAEYAQQLAPMIMQLIGGGLTGSPTSGQMAGNLTAQNQLRRTAGQMGISPGDPRIMQGLQQLAEQLTMPNPDLLKSAIAMYAGAPDTGGKSRTTSTPGMGDFAQLAASIALLGGSGGTSAGTTASPFAMWA